MSAKKRVNAGGASTAPAEAPAAAPVEVKDLNPVTTEFEFMGPYLGSLGVSFGLPVLVWAASYYCNNIGWPSIPKALPTLADVRACFSLEALAVYVGWWAFQAALYMLVPGDVIDGTQLRDGKVLKYRINGFRCLLITAATAAGIHVYVTPITWVCDHFVELAVAAILFSFALSFYLYASSFVGKKLLALGGNSRIPIYDFFIGRELNPRISFGPLGDLDLKYFCELRPGLFLWLLFDVAMLLRQFENGVTDDYAMWLVVALQALYVADSVFCEECILTTMDIIMDGFGFMLVFGDLAWVPFMYSLQTRYLADFPLRPSLPFIAAVASVAITGFYIFRASNAQKDTFKKDPNHPSVKHLRVVVTDTGRKLLAGGWWGVSRHLNYFGDWLLSLGMSLCTGFNTPVTYFYPIYFAVLLWHREMRDEHKCAAKYGKYWTEYKQKVPYRIIPYVY